MTPSTNPAATVINNAIKPDCGQQRHFCPASGGEKVSQRAITLLNQAIVAAGRPEKTPGFTVANPDIETAQRLFKFPGISLLVVTGGEAVVEAARKRNKRLIAAGAGNPPVVVDET